MVLTIYSKPDCHLCDDMKTLVRRVAEEQKEIVVQEIDISTDAGLLERYGLEIPVLMVDGRKVAKYRIGEKELRRAMQARD